jgi:Ribose/xylose/arabinose/galactoside ABC-type transport systems, permease components
MTDNNKKATTTIEQKVDVRKTDIDKVTLIMNRAGILVIVLLLAVIGFAINPSKYFSVDNIRSVFQAMSLTGMVCTGLAYIVYSANMNDMSIPMAIAMSGMVSVQLLPFGLIICLLGGIAVGVVIGLVNGIMIGKFKANPIIWTLAFNMVLSGIARVAWAGTQIYPDVIVGGNEAGQKTAEAFTTLARMYFFGGSVSLMMIVMVVLFIISYIIMTKTKFGAQVKMVGSNYEAARLSGVNCTKVVTICYILCSVASAVCGIFYASMREIGAYENGTGYDFLCLTAVLLGGMTLAGGKGSIIGVFGGVLAVGMLNNIMSLIGISTFNQYLVQGIVFLFIVWLSSRSARKMGRA